MDKWKVTSSNIPSKGKRKRKPHLNMEDKGKVGRTGVTRKLVRIVENREPHLNRQKIPPKKQENVQKSKASCGMLYGGKR